MSNLGASIDDSISVATETLKFSSDIENITIISRHRGGVKFSITDPMIGSVLKEYLKNVRTECNHNEYPETIYPGTYSSGYAFDRDANEGWYYLDKEY